MSNKCKVLLGDTSLGFGRLCADELKRHNFDVTTVENNGLSIFNAIKQDYPDIVVIDYYASYMGAVAVIKQAQEFLHYHGFYIVTSAQDNALIRQELEKIPRVSFLLKPFDISYLCQEIQELSDKVPTDVVCQDHPLSVEYVVSQELEKLRVPVHLKGYGYIKDAILEGVDDLHSLELITKILYPKIAKKHKTTSTCVEKAIRKAIDVTWGRTSKEVLVEYFGEVNKKPSNLLFLKTIAERIHRDFQKYNSTKIG